LDVAYSVQQTTDAGYIVAGCKPSDVGDTDAWLIKIRYEELECPEEFKEADVNDDNTVDMGDLFAITKSGYWGCYPGCESGFEEFDLNDDNTVDMGDLFAVTKSGYWGTTCP